MKKPGINDIKISPQESEALIKEIEYLQEELKKEKNSVRPWDSYKKSHHRSRRNISYKI